MISAKDVMDFHVPSKEDDNRNWAETNFFGFYNSKEQITIGVYLIFRKQFNLVLSNVFAVKGFGRDATNACTTITSVSSDSERGASWEIIPLRMDST